MPNFPRGILSDALGAAVATSISIHRQPIPTTLPVRVAALALLCRILGVGRFLLGCVLLLVMSGAQAPRVQIAI